MIPPIEIVAAVSRNGVIGANGSIPWRIPDDLRNFAQITANGIVVMGSRTWISIPTKFRPLKGRRNIVLSRTLADAETEGAERFPSWEDALAALAGDDRTVFVIGGSAIYAKALPLARAIHLTRVHMDVDGDTFFPCFDPADWQETSREDHPGFRFLRLERIPEPRA